MNRKRRTLLILFLPLAVLMAVSAGAIYRDYRQQQLNQDLIVSLKRGDIAAEVHLLNAGADANARDMGEQPVTFWDVIRGYWQRLRTGKRMQTKFYTPALVVVANVYIGNEATRIAQPNRYNGNEAAAIAQALPLLDHRANIESRDKDHDTVLFYACAGKFPHFAQLLIDKGADVNSADDAGVTPLEMAILYNNLEAVKILLKAGANVNCQDKQRDSPLKYAKHYAWVYINKRKSHQEIIRLLQQAGAHE